MLFLLQRFIQLKGCHLPMSFKEVTGGDSLEKDSATRERPASLTFQQNICILF